MDHLKAEVNNHLESDSWREYMQNSDPESYAEYIQGLEDTQEHVLPYLQEFCNLEERAPEKGFVDVSLAASSSGEKAAASKSAKSMESKADGRKSEGKAQTSEDKAKKSIHERLKENKERITKSQGKDNPQRGVELA